MYVHGMKGKKHRIENMSSNFHIKQCLGVRRSGDIVFNGLVQAFCFTLLKISKFIQVKSKTSFVKKNLKFPDQQNKGAEYNCMQQ